MLLLNKLAPLLVLPLMLARSAHLLPSNSSTAHAIQRHGTTSNGVDGHLYICSLPYWKGKCANLGFKTGVCENMPFPLGTEVQSSGPDIGRICELYELDACQGYFKVELRYPGENDLPGMSWMTSYGSFRCTWNRDPRLS